jgi:hypothetical protein
MKFKKIKINQWKQFENLDIDFHPKLTVLTGANCSGKTTILNLLSKHFGWNFQELSTPAKDKESGLIRFFNRFFKFPFSKTGKSDDNIIGSLHYDNNTKADLTLPDSDSVQYQVKFDRIQHVEGFFIPSHRYVFSYIPIDQFSPRKRKKKQAFDLVSNSYRQRTFGSSDKPSNYYIKESLLTWAIFGEGNRYIEPDREQISYFLDFQEILRKILPPSIGFREFTIRNTEIVLITDSGDFMLDAVSGGISNLIDLSWQIFMYETKENNEFVVLIDEVENHLHATMQRHVLPDLLKAFPHVQFIVSTHNPLIVGSVRESNVYALRYNENNKVFSEQLDLINKTNSASEILREVLGVPFTMPLWVEDEYNRIYDKYSNKEISNKLLTELRQDMKTIGLENLIPAMITKVVDTRDKNK